jgi:hypothetical protein
MKLIWYRYNNKYKLGVLLGITGGKTVILDDDLMDKTTTYKLRQNIKKSGSVSDNIQLIKEVAPEAVVAMKTLITSNVHVVKEYEIKPAS